MDTIYKYFLKEMAWLERAGRDFAEANPGLNTFLHGGGQVGDPHVDRILEGSAFLAARLEKRLDDSLLKMAEDLLGLTYPELMTPQPAMTLVQYRARKPVREPKAIAAGAQFAVRPNRRNGEQVRLTVCDAVTVCDLAVSEVSLEETSYIDRSLLRVTVGPERGQALADKAPLPASIPVLLFWNNLADSCTIYHAIRQAPEPPLLTAVMPDGTRTELAGGCRLRLREPGGFWPILDTGRRAFPGFRLMREFFALPQRFLQVDLVGLDACEELAGAAALELDLILPLAVADLPVVEARNFLMHTTAVCNQWQGEAKQINVDGTRDREEIKPHQDGDTAIIGVEGVRILPRGTDEFRILAPFNYFKSAEPCYRVSSETYELSEAQRSERWFLELNAVAQPGQSILACVDLNLCNRTAGDVVAARTELNSFDGVPADFTGVTILPCTRFVPALDAEGRYWQLVDMMACNLASLSDPIRLQLFLQHLNRTSSTVMSSAIRGIRDVNLQMTTTSLAQQPVKLARMTVSIDRNEYLNRGFVDLFYAAFHAFLQEFVPLNCLLELIVSDLDTEETLCRWEPDLGRIAGTSRPG